MARHVCRAAWRLQMSMAPDGVTGSDLAGESPATTPTRTGVSFLSRGGRLQYLSELSHYVAG
jgi:hypothetical protein